MIDYLVRLPTSTTAKTVLAKWLARDEQGRDAWRLPTWCDLLVVDAFSVLAVADVLDADGSVKIAGTAALKAPGWWALIALGTEVAIPPAFQSYIKAQGEREAGMTLPAGIAGLSTAWAGMTVRST